MSYIKKLIKRLDTKVHYTHDNKNVYMTPCVYETKYGNCIIFEADVGCQKVGLWGVEKITQSTKNTFCLDHGQDWFVIGMDAVRDELINLNI